MGVLEAAAWGSAPKQCGLMRGWVMWWVICSQWAAFAFSHPDRDRMMRSVLLMEGTARSNIQKLSAPDFQRLDWME